MKNISKTIIIGAVAGFTAVTAAAQELPDSAKVNVAFRSVEQSELMGGVSAIDMENLEEKDYTSYSLDDMTSLVGGFSGYNGSLWGMGDALILVDGVPRDANNVLPNEIAQITFLKSAQAVVLYGSRGAKGVILITTKRGNDQPLKVTVRGNASLYVPKSYTNYLGASDFMTLYNEALQNDGLTPAFSQEDIYNYASHKNPYRYPDINFFSSDYIRKNYQKYEGVAEFRGGSRFAKFYANVGLYHQNGLINFGQGKDNGITRLTVRGNIDLRLNDWISGWVNTNATFYDSKTDRADFWNNSKTMRPMNPGASPLVPLIPIDAVTEGDGAWTLINNSQFIVDGKYIIGGTQDQMTNPFAAMYAAGWNKSTIRQFQFDTGIDIKLDKVLEGLRFRTQYAVDYRTNYTTSINNQYATYEAKWDNALGKEYITSLTKYGLDKTTGKQEVSGSGERQTMAFNALFDYKNTFNDVHNVYAMLLANGYQITTAGEYHRTSNANLGVNVSYNYDNRYYAEFSGAEVHSSKLPEGKRNAFSPTGSIGWRISQEKFAEDADWLDELKLSAGYSVVNEDLDISDYYMYEERFTTTGAWWGWSETNNAMQTTDYRRGGNSEMTYIKRKELTVSLNSSFFNNRIRFYADFFNTKFAGQLAIPATMFPSYFQTYWPESDMRSYYNFNDTRRTGFDWGLNLSEKFDEVSVSLGFFGMYNTTKNTKWSENVEYDWLKSEGAYSDALRGLRCAGYWNSEEEIAAAAKSENYKAGGYALVNSNTKPGDLKYIDQNGDGIIDGKDEVVIGRWGAPWTYGLNLQVAWKGFSLFVATHGNRGGNTLKNNDAAWIYGDRKYTDIVLGRWTPETAETATYPRLTSQNNGDLNFRSSDYWLISTDAFYLDKVQLTYDFPKRWFAQKFVSGLQVYVSGSSLATFAKERKYLETNVGSEPQCRMYNLGVKVDF